MLLLLKLVANVRHCQTVFLYRSRLGFGCGGCLKGVNFGLCTAVKSSVPNRRDDQLNTPVDKLIEKIIFLSLSLKRNVKFIENV